MLLLVILGCSPEVNRTNFPELFAEEQCTLYKRCYRTYFDGEFETMSRCVEGVGSDISEEVQELYGECSFVQEKGQTCLNEISAATCAEYWDEYHSPGAIYSLCHEETWNCE